MEWKKKIRRIKELTALLTEAGKAYYQESRELMSNYQYDQLYDELAGLEKETGVILSGSPTQKVGYEVLSELPKEAHESPMLSLDKTKDVEDLAQWLGDQAGLLSWKLDGLTIVLTYENGSLVKAVTRGNGGDRGGDYQQCQGVFQCPLIHRLQGPAGAAGRGGDFLFGF